MRNIYSHYLTAIYVIAYCTELFIVLMSVSIRYVQEHNCTVFCVREVCAVAILYYILCHCGMYSVLIILQSVIAVCTGTIFTAISVSTVCTG